MMNWKRWISAPCSISAIPLATALKPLFPYGTILHGEAVALGMRAALFLSERKAGLSSSDAKKILCTLQALELPLVLPDDIDTETVLKKTASDKKFRAGTIRFVLLSKAGEAGISKKITREDMAEAIEELRRPLP